MRTFKALVVEETSEDTFERSIQEWPMDQLPDHDVLINVKYSSLNYKDALSATGNKGVTRTFPHIPGIDAAGIVEESAHTHLRPGDKVLVTGYDLGQNTSGGFGQYIRVPEKWVVPLPKKLSLQESMLLGTAGLTAAIGVHHLQHNEVQPENGPILVTGASGGVGTMAIGILSKLGYKVTAATGKMDRKDLLKSLGAETVIHRDEVQDQSQRPLLSSRWNGVIDTVGGLMLDTALRQTNLHGTVACCGNVLGHELNTNVYPFILRGVILAGIDSGNCKMSLRKKMWDLLADEWKPGNMKEIMRECSLEELDHEISKILEGRQVGRVVVDLND